MITLTKEWLLKTIAELEEERDATPGTVNEDAAKALAAMKLALASIEVEPVAWLLSGGGAKNNVSFDSGNAYVDPLREVTPLYTAPPAPVSMPDESAIFDAAIDICRKSDAIDEHVWNHGVLAVMSAFSDCRAAMLKHSEPFIVTSDHRMMEMPQVEAINAVTAMLQGAEPVTTANKLPAIGWLRADYQDDNRGLRGNAPLFVLGKKDPSTVWGLDYIPLTSNSPVIPDGWVACSERMPGIGTEIFYFCQDDGLRDCGIVSSSNFSGKGDAELYVHAEGYDLRLGVDITHWMPLPAAPQQGGVLFNVFVIVLYR